MLARDARREESDALRAARASALTYVWKDQLLSVKNIKYLDHLTVGQSLEKAGRHERLGHHFASADLIFRYAYGLGGGARDASIVRERKLIRRKKRRRRKKEGN